MNDALKSTLLHVIELAVCLVAAYSILFLFGAGDEVKTALLTLVLNAVSKFARSNEAIPYKDFVNE